ncbi:MAG: serine hydrolase domain-containing protein [Acidimicrobiia bacterium]
MERVARVVRTAVETDTVPGAVVLVRYRDEVILHEAFGWAATAPDPRPMRLDTLFDLASLTKPLVGATVAAALVDRGALSLDEEITGFLPELQTLRGQGVTLRGLLSHTSGLPGWRPLYVWARGKEEILGVVDRLGLASAPGSRFEYSDLGYLTLGLALERVGDRPLEDLVAELVFDPLGLRRTRYRPSEPPDAFAVTEQGNAFERRMSEWAGLDFADWRTEFHPGQVNDGNAHYGLGGVSAHAGLFSDAHDLGVLGEMWRGLGIWQNRRVLSRAVVEEAIVDQAPGGARRGLGWDLMKTGGPTVEELTRADAGFFPPTESPWSPRPSGELLSPAAFGHTGFTGTSIWIDPGQELVAVLLTNATHPRVDLGKPVNALRARFHNAIAAALDWER